MKKKLITLLLALIMAAVIAVPAFAAQPVVTTESRLEQEGLSIDITNKYVGPAEVQRIPLGDDVLLDEFKELSAYTAADTMTKAAGFEAIPKSFKYSTGDTGITGDSNYGLGQFVIAAAPNSSGAAALSASEAAAPSGLLQSDPLTQIRPDAAVLIIVIVLLIGAATGVLISLAVKENRKP